MAKLWLVLGVALAFLSVLESRSEAQEAKKSVTSVYIIGAVLKPSVHDFVPGETVGQFIARAGGAIPGALLSRVRIIRDGKDLFVNVAGDVTTKNASDGNAEFLLRAGDVVVLVQSEVTVGLGRVYVGGDVARAGYVSLLENGTLTVAQALASVGGVCDGRKNIQVSIGRKNDAGKLEWRKVAPNELEKELLQNDDLVSIYVEKRQIYVGGEVTKPGFVELPDDGQLSIAQAIALAGGLRNADAEFKITLVRPNMEKKTEFLDIPWDNKTLFLNRLWQNVDMLLIMRKITGRSEPPIAPPTAQLWLLKSR